MPPLPQKSPKADVLDHLAGSLDSKWRSFGKNFKRCRKKFSQKAVHDSRVTTRRLLSTLELLQPFVTKSKLRKASKALKEYLDCFDQARDAHVQLDQLEQFKQFSAARPFKKWLEKQEDRFSRQTHKAIRKFDHQDLADRIAALKKELHAGRKTQTSDRAFIIVIRSVNRMFREVFQARRRIKRTDTTTIHCTRIAFKHFRYALEELAPLLPTVTRARCEKMHDFQSTMGNIQDIEVFLGAFNQFTKKKKVDSVIAEHFRAEIKRRRQKLIENFLQEAHHLNDFRL